MDNPVRIIRGFVQNKSLNVKVAEQEDAKLALQKMKFLLSSFSILARLDRLLDQVVMTSQRNAKKKEDGKKKKFKKTKFDYIHPTRLRLSSIQSNLINHRNSFCSFLFFLLLFFLFCG